MPAVVCALLLLAPASASATVFSNTSSIALNDPNTQVNGNNNATATPYPSTISVSGMSGTVSDITATLSNVSYGYSQDIDVLLVGPQGQSLILVANMGPNSGASAAASNSTLTLSDAGVLPPSGALTPWGSTATFKPVDYGGFNEIWESPAPSSGLGDPGASGTGATLSSQFGGTNPNGTWSLYVITTAGGDGTGAIAGGWSLGITTASATATTTVLTSSNNPSFTTNPGSSVTLTASVTSTSTVGEGTVAFTDGGVTIAGCGAVPVTGGTATCTTSFTTEASHSLNAQYSGDANFGASNASLSQQVDNHTTVTGNSYCNTGSIALNNPPVTLADASPYPSHVFVSGLAGAITHLTVTLNGATYGQSQDIDALLVGPGGQTLILAANAGPNSSGAISNVTLTLDDAAASMLASDAIWGAPNSSVASEPFNYGGFNETFGAPAPAGPYGNPGPSGGGTATLGSVFNGASGNGTWSLYVITTAAGDGTGAIAGGWCANITTADVAATTTTLSSDNNPSFTTAPGDAVTLTASVKQTSDNSNVGEGTVEFTSDGTTISGCGAVPVTGGTASCPTSFTTEGSHTIQALYSGDANFGAGNASLSQQVDDHTTVAEGTYCNAGSIGLNNPALTVADASPYPSHISVAGLPGNLSNLSVTLNSVTYGNSQDIDALLVGPGGQTLILAANAGPNSSGAISNVTLTLDDAAASMLASDAIWGAPNSSVASEPFNYGGFNETFGAPAPAGPYGNPGPSGGGTATLGSVFNGASGNGTWSLYVITTAAGDGTGAIAGGWCLNPTLTPATPTITTQVSPATIPLTGSFTDTATVAGPDPANDLRPTGNVTFTVFGPNDPNCSNPPALASAAIPLTGSSTGPGTATSGDLTPAAVGTYHVRASYDGDSNYSALESGCTDANETVTVGRAAPAIATTASAAVTIGGTIADSATLSGGLSASGTITFSAYGPDNATCSGTAAFTSSVPVNGNGSYASGAETPTTAGTYRWVASYSGDANNAGVSSSCTDPAESVVIAQVAAGTTLASSLNPSMVGQAVTFTATVTGASPSGTVTFKDGSSALGTVAVGAGGKASLTTASLSAGSHTITASYSGDTSNAAGTSAPLTQVTTKIRRPSNRFKVSHITTHADGSVTFRLKLPGPGKVDVLETSVLPARKRFVFSRKHITARDGGTLAVTVIPNRRGQVLLARHRHRVTLRLWISYTPTGGTRRDIGYYGLRIPHIGAVSYTKPRRVNRSP